MVLTFSLPGMLYIVCRGQVKYLKQIKVGGHKISAYGIQFVNIDFAARRKIRTYVARKSFEEAAAI